MKSSVYYTDIMQKQFDTFADDCNLCQPLKMFIEIQCCLIFKKPLVGIKSTFLIIKFTYEGIALSNHLTRLFQFAFGTEISDILWVFVPSFLFLVLVDG